MPTVKEIVDFLGTQCLGGTAPKDFVVTHPESLDSAKKNSVTFSYKPITENRLGVIICPVSDANGNTLIFALNPRLAFMRVIREFFSKPVVEIHPTAIIYPNVILGRNVNIEAGAVIGGDGFGYERNERGELEKFPHLGGVVIGDDVEIGANTCIDRGTLVNTVIGVGTKIDNLVHVAHNVKIGKHVHVVAHAMIAGGVKIGDYSFISSSYIMPYVTIGRNVIVGMGSVVLHDVPDGATVYGVPAKVQGFIRDSPSPISPFLKVDWT